jgi:flagellar assembly protein FliH
MDFKPLAQAIAETVDDFIPVRLVVSESAVESPGSPPVPASWAGPADEETVYQRSLEDAVAAAFQSGFAKGRHQTLEDTNQKLASSIEAWEKTLAELNENFHRELEDFCKLLEERSIKLTVAIAEKIIRRELSRDPQVLGRLIAGAMSGLKDESRILLRLAPEDKEFVDSWLVKTRDHLPELSITADYQIEGGGFMIDTRSGSLDYTMQNQLERIETELENLYVQP